MRKQLMIILFFASFANAQNFFENDSEIFQEEPKEIFTETENPEFAATGLPGTPGEPLPINQGWYLLVAGAMALGYHFLYTKPQKKNL